MQIFSYIERYGRKNESQDVSIDLDREALRGCWGMPCVEWVTPERLLKEVKICTGIYSG